MPIIGNNTEVVILTGGLQGPPGPPGADGAPGPPGTTLWAGIQDKPATFPPDAHQHSIADVATLAEALANLQPLNTRLSQIANLTPANDDFLQFKSGVWANRTLAQVKTDLGITSVVTASGGSSGVIPKFTSATALGASRVWDNGSNISIGTSPLTGCSFYCRDASGTNGYSNNSFGLNVDHNVSGLGATVINCGNYITTLYRNPIASTFTYELCGARLALSLRSGGHTIPQMMGGYSSLYVANALSGLNITNAYSHYSQWIIGSGTTGTLSNYYGYFADFSYNNSALIQTAYAYSAQFPTQNCVNLIGLALPAMTIANRVAILLGTITPPAGAYTIYSTSTDPSYFAGPVKFGGNVGFNNTDPVARPAVTGSRAGNAALASLLTGLAGLGLIIDGTTA